MPNDINERGQVVGTSEICPVSSPGRCSDYMSIHPVPMEPSHAFLWEGGISTDLGALAGLAIANIIG